MKDEEMAEEYTEEEGFGSDCNNLTSYDANREIEQAFLAGLKVGRPQWHDLRKDKNDLPKEGTKVISEKGDFVFLQDKRWKEFSPNWDNIPLRKWEEPIAWCEIPTFDKE